MDLDSADPESLILQLFELKEVLLEKKMVKFYAKGICMFPCIRPRDSLHIKQKNAEKIKVGDIAVYRGLNRLFAHRTVKKGKDNGRDYIFTRPDTAGYGNEGPIFDKDILGVLSCIKRKGQILSTEKKDYNSAAGLFLNICFKGHHFCGRLFRVTIHFAAYIQQFKIYRMITNFLFTRLNKKIDFSIQVPLNSRTTNRFYRIISPEEFAKGNIEKGKDYISKWAVKMSINSKPAASLSFIFEPQNCPFSGWWISEARVNIRYRGTGVEEELFQRVDGLLKQSGVSQIFVGVSERAYLEQSMFKRLGFREILAREGSMDRIIMIREVNL
jgi:hypothetical protein